MKNVCPISESISDLCRAQPQPWKNKVLQYLKNGKRGIAETPTIPTDIISGERIEGKLYCLTDGEYSWRSDLIHYVEKYNIELDHSFVKKVLSSS